VLGCSSTATPSSPCSVTSKMAAPPSSGADPVARRIASFPRRQLSADIRGYLRRNRGRLLLVAIGYLAIGAVGSVVEFYLLGHGPAFWYTFGAFHAFWLAVLVGMVGLGWLASSQPAILYLRGAFGEDNTTEVLKAARRKSVWGFVASMAVIGGDIDHLVVTRSGGVLAIDSKWSNEVTVDRLEAMAVAARKAARRAESIMRSEHVGTLKRERGARHRAGSASYAVRPVVVIWGAAGHRMPDSARRADVEFVAGPKLAQWLRTLDGELVDKAAARDLLARLADFRDR
jgi:hypothetical protein